MASWNPWIMASTESVLLALWIRDFSSLSPRPLALVLRNKLPPLGRRPSAGACPGRCPAEADRHTPAVRKAGVVDGINALLLVVVDGINTLPLVVPVPPALHRGLRAPAACRGRACQVSAVWVLEQSNVAAPLAPGTAGSATKERTCCFGCRGCTETVVVRPAVTVPPVTQRCGKLPLGEELANVLPAVTLGVPTVPSRPAGRGEVGHSAAHGTVPSEEGRAAVRAPDKWGVRAAPGVSTPPGVEGLMTLAAPCQRCSGLPATGSMVVVISPSRRTGWRKDAWAFT
mmetsp:Transcript_14108/g.40314  ORF Transcript_14108/g.40314 Transcript_14108/m.40314 type:complete len:286 (+) Transcript_14108:628-1485(+)